MDRIWQWAWDRHGARYSWAVFAVAWFLMLSGYLFWSLAIVAFERSDQYLVATVVTVVAVAAMTYLMVLPGRSWIRLAENWAAGRVVDRVKALGATYIWARTAVARSVGVNAVCAALLLLAVAGIAHAS